MKKIISIILTIATILGLLPGIIFYKPQKAQAFWGIGDISIDIVNQVKDWIVDQLPKTVARHMMVRLQQEIARWAQGGFTDENKPFAMTSWKEELKDILDITTGRFIQDFNLTPLCVPIKVSLGTALGFNMPYGIVPYTEYAACTFDTIKVNVEEFYKNPSIGVYGWDTWTALTRPQNNIFGSALMAAQRMTEIQEEEIQEKEKEIEAGGGIKNEAICNETDQEACAKNCNQYPATVGGFPNPDFVACLKSCEKSSIGVCLQKTTKKLGSEIKTSVEKAIGSDIDWLISADEITEMIDIVFSGLFNKLVRGVNGMLTKAFYKPTDTVAKNQAEYGYQAAYKKTQTPEDINKLKREILNNILESLKRLTTSGYDCDKDNQLKGDVYSEVAAEILDQESQHLYTSLEGVNLKPDFIVLDSPQAVKSGVAIYGQTWDDIPFNRYPEKCQKIADKKCSEIKTGLPYELKIENINAECTTGCLATINTYRETCGAERATCLANCPTGTTSGLGIDPARCRALCQTAYDNCVNSAVSRAVADGQCSSTTIGWACLNGAILIDKTENLCKECVKKYQDSCELKETPEEKDSCIESYCGNYKDVSTSIESAQDFYNRCALNEIRYSCETCLKEYFMPADYCDQIYDYVNRAFIKYPALVYEDLWWGTYNKFDECADNEISNPDFNWWSVVNPIWARYETMKWLTANRKGYIPVGLTCRILPDFKFPSGRTCKDYCKATEEELRDLTDNKPTDLDCTGEAIHPSWGGVWDAKALHPGGQYIPYLVRKRAKCCAALTGHDPELYKKCRGEIPGQVQTTACTYAVPVDQEPQCYCKEGDRPLGFTRTGLPRSGGLGGDCSDFDFDSPGKKVYSYTNAAPKGDKVYIATGKCTEKDESWENTTGTGTEGQIDVDHQTGTDATGPSGIIDNCTWEADSQLTDKFCDLSGVSGTVHAGTYHNDNSDQGSTGWHVCVACDPNDNDYPYYGTGYDQCTGKVSP
ncbi:MAG: hypothetical protein ACOZAL_02910 [Patescibacteria group bacterium]